MSVKPVSLKAGKSVLVAPSTNLMQFRQHVEVPEPGGLQDALRRLLRVEGLPAVGRYHVVVLVRDDDRVGGRRTVVVGDEDVVVLLVKQRVHLFPLLGL